MSVVAVYFVCVSLLCAVIEGNRFVLWGKV